MTCTVKEKTCTDLYTYNPTFVSICLMISSMDLCCLIRSIALFGPMPEETGTHMFVNNVVANFSMQKKRFVITKEEIWLHLTLVWWMLTYSISSNIFP